MALIKSKTADKDNWVVSQIDNAGCSALTTNHFIKSTIHSLSHSIIPSSVVDLNFVDGNKNLLHRLDQILTSQVSLVAIYFKDRYPFRCSRSGGRG